MLESLEYYQSLAQKFQSQILTGPGIIIVLLGLCIWLAGLRWRRIVGALAGVTIAAAGVFSVGPYSANVFLTACIVGLAAGIIINRIVFGIFGAAIGALLVIVIQAGGLAPVENESPFISTWPEYEQNDTVINARTALNITVQMAGFLVDSVKKTVVSARIIHFAGAGLAVVIAVGLVVFAPRLFIAIVSSALGSAVIFTGMIILLFYKGSKPISYIAQKPHFFAMVFAAMLIFGSAVQIVLSPLQLKKSQPDSTDEDKEKNRFRTL